MTDARDQILSTIRRSLGRGPLGAAESGAIRARLAAHGRHIIPARVDLEADSLVDLFVTKAEGVSASVAQVPEMSAIPGAVAEYLSRENLPARLVRAPGLDGLDWSAAPTLETRAGAAGRDDEVGLTQAVAGVAETGTLLMISGPETPTTLNFAPPAHIVVLRRDEVVASYEDAWDRVRARGAMPRAVNFITGPSRTGDIEQQIQIGVHGPLRLYVILVGD